MAEFICKDELKRRIATQEPCTYDELEELIDDVPVLDVEKLLADNFERKIVRCKNCNYGTAGGECCDYINGLALPKPDGFCSYGKVKTNNFMVGEPPSDTEGW